MNASHVYPALETIVKDDLPTRLYTAEQTRTLDRLAIEEHRIPGHCRIFAGNGRPAVLNLEYRCR